METMLGCSSHDHTSWARVPHSVTTACLTMTCRQHWSERGSGMQNEGLSGGLMQQSRDARGGGMRLARLCDVVVFM